MKYLATAEKQLKAATSYMEEIEESINADHPDELDAWRKEELEWKGKVVDLTQHQGLGNPYESAPTTGM